MGTSSSRERLLRAVVDIALRDGISDRSLRAIAEASGTSHRMLIHHFGSKEKLLVEVVRAVEARQRAQFEALLADSGRASEDLAQRFWQHLRSRELGRQERLFFEIYGQALQGREWAVPMLDGIVEDWITPVAAMLQKHAAIGAGAARALARLGLAVSRGLLLDVLATGEDREVDEAMRHFQLMLRHYLESRAPRA